MNTDKKINWFLWVGLCIPVVALVFVAFFAYAPVNISVKYDFLYYIRDNSRYYCNNGEVFKVKDQKVSVIDIKMLPKDYGCLVNPAESDPPKIYYYNVKTDERKQITLAEAQKLRVDNNTISPDNISVQRGNSYNAGIFELFGAGNRDYNSIYFKNENNNFKKIDLGLSNSYDFMFIGWVIR